MLSNIALNDDPGSMLSKAGKKLNFEFSNIARYYGQTSFLRNPETAKKSKSTEVKYPKRLLGSNKEAAEPFKLFKGRDMHKEAREAGLRAPPVGTYNPKSDIRIKTMRIYSRENPLKDSRGGFVRCMGGEGTPGKLGNAGGGNSKDDKENLDSNINPLNTMRNNLIGKNLKNNNFTENKPEKIDKTDKKSIFNRKSTVNYYDQFKHEKKGIGLIDFARHISRKSIRPQNHREFDLRDIDCELLSHHKKSSTDIYFVNKNNQFKKTREKFVRKMNFYNAKLDVVKPKVARMVPAFDKDSGRRPMSVGDRAVNHVFYDYEKIGKRVPVIDFDKLWKF